VKSTDDVTLNMLAVEALFQYADYAGGCVEIDGSAMSLPDGKEPVAMFSGVATNIVVAASDPDGGKPVSLADNPDWIPLAANPWITPGSALGTRLGTIPATYSGGILSFVADIARDAASATFLYEIVSLGTPRVE
jgi:hypothetical protein